jgi:hypothetical protein
MEAEVLLQILQMAVEMKLRMEGLSMTLVEHGVFSSVDVSSEEVSSMEEPPSNSSSD